MTKNLHRRWDVGMCSTAIMFMMASVAHCSNVPMSFSHNNHTVELLHHVNTTAFDLLDENNINLPGRWWASSTLFLVIVTCIMCQFCYAHISRCCYFRYIYWCIILKSVLWKISFFSPLIMKITDTATFSQICLAPCPWNWCEEKGASGSFSYFSWKLFNYFWVITTKLEHSRKLWAQSQGQYICQRHKLILPLVSSCTAAQMLSGSRCISLKEGLTPARRFHSTVWEMDITKSLAS